MHERARAVVAGQDFRSSELRPELQLPIKKLGDSCRDTMSDVWMRHCMRLRHSLATSNF